MYFLKRNEFTNTLKLMHEVCFSYMKLQANVGLFIFCLDFMHEIVNSFSLGQSLGVDWQQTNLGDPEFAAWATQKGLE